MKTAFEAVWEHGQLVPVEASIRIHEHARLLVVILDEQAVKISPAFVEEARRQSLLASQHANAEDDLPGARMIQGFVKDHHPDWKALKGKYRGKLSPVDEFIRSKQDEKRLER